MKSRYKIGMLISFVHNANQEHGFVSGIVTRETGTAYEIKGSDFEVEEKDVTGAYRQVAARKALKAPKASKKATRMNSRVQESETQATAN